MLIYLFLCESKRVRFRGFNLWWTLLTDELVGDCVKAAFIVTGMWQVKRMQSTFMFFFFLLKQ